MHASSRTVTQRRVMCHVHQMEMEDAVQMETSVRAWGIVSAIRKVIIIEVLVRILPGEILLVLIIVLQTQIVSPSNSPLISRISANGIDSGE